jgi:hypothetical protein
MILINSSITEHTETQGGDGGCEEKFSRIGPLSQFEKDVINLAGGVWRSRREFIVNYFSLAPGLVRRLKVSP